jgi:hypothetical protein
VKLTRDTLASFLASLPESILPKTFQDTIQVVRRLGLRYLWIDSLCIVQDSTDDWTAESSVMGRVYKNAEVNIAATASTDSSGGLFFDREPRTVQPGVALSGWDDCPPSTYIVSKSKLWEEGVSKAVLNTRGWVLQERCLSPRIIHFGADQIYWECLELLACEIFPSGLPPTLRARRLHLPTGEEDFKNRGKELRPVWQQPPLPAFDCYRVWKQLVETYSRARLSHPTDKLIAISALAKEARQILRDDYLAGLWRRHLGWELGWTADIWPPSAVGTHDRASGYRAPTWSWASIDGEIRYTDYGEDVLLLVDVLDAEVTPQGKDDTGALSGGWVQIRGFLYPILLVYNDTAEKLALFVADKIGGTEHQMVCSLKLDVPVPIFHAGGSLDDYYILLHHCSGLWDETIYLEDGYLQVHALLLKYDTATKTYTRHGMVQISHEFEQIPVGGVGHVIDIWPLRRAWRQYAPSIPYEALDEELGYTITLV